MTSDSPQPSRGLADLLVEADLKRLRAGFSEREISDMATQIYIADYPPAAAFVEAAQTFFFREHKTFEMSFADRERVLIALLAAQGLERQLAVHVYWGLMVGLSSNDVAETLVLMGTYAGIGKQNAAMGVFRRAIVALQDVAKGSKKKAIPMKVVLPRLLQDFPN